MRLRRRRRRHRGARHSDWHSSAARSICALRGRSDTRLLCTALAVVAVVVASSSFLLPAGCGLSLTIPSYFNRAVKRKRNRALDRRKKYPEAGKLALVPKQEGAKATGRLNLCVCRAQFHPNGRLR